MEVLKNVSGYFDCRVYKNGVPRNNRIMVDNHGRINLSASFEEHELPKEVKEFAKLSEKSGKYFVSFKIFPKNCKLYNSKAKQIPFPDNSLLDGKKFLVNIIFNIKHGTGTELNGCYVNSLQIVKDLTNPFEAVEDGDEDVFNIEVEKSESGLTKHRATDMTQTTAPDNEGSDDLPF